MFERYTEHARRTVFFAHHEANSLGQSYIETEHLLLGVIREDRSFAGCLPSGAAESIRRQIHANPPISTSIDLPLSQESQRALGYAAEEAGKLSHKSIDTGHLVLGLLRVENCTASKFLHQFGIQYTSYAEVVRDLGAPQSATTPAASFLSPMIDRLRQLLGNVVPQLSEQPIADGAQRLKRRPWTREEAVGHLVDWAIVHQQLFARALTEPNVVAASYPSDDWVQAENYAGYSWTEIVALWCNLNGLLVHVLSKIPEDKLNVPCRIGVASPIPLRTLIERYVEHCEDIAGQILARL